MGRGNLFYVSLNHRQYPDLVSERSIICTAEKRYMELMGVGGGRGGGGGR